MNDKVEFIESALIPYFTGELEFSIGEEGKCLYRGTNGSKCVLGRYIKDECYEPKMDYSAENSAMHIIENYPQDILKDEAKGILNTREWDAMQAVHDRGAKKTIGMSMIGLLEESAGVELPNLRQAVETYINTIQNG